MNRVRLKCACPLIAALVCVSVAPAAAATISVPAGGDLQAAINAAQPGDTISLEPGATYVGNFKLPVHVGTTYITIRTGGPDSQLPASGTRVSPAFAPYFAKIRSGNTTAAMRTLPGAAFWRVMFVEFQGNVKGMNDIIALGDGSSAQNSTSLVPHHVILDRVYVHGDPVNGQKRGIALNSGLASILNSYVSDIKLVGQDTQAIAGWNGPGPYRIENNYLEAAAEVFLLGGDDPKIPGLTPADVIVRGNTLSRPLSWRDPILAMPSGARASVTQDGALTAGTYAYRVLARRILADGTVVRSFATPEVTVTVAAGANVTLTWNAVPDAADYLIYGRTPGAQSISWRATTTTFADDGIVASTAGTVPATATVWQVKNMLELKNAKRVQIDYNIIENSWSQAQVGIAVLFTPRNQYGACTWCVVEDVTFEYNILRGIAGGINIQGWDDLAPSQQTRNIRIANNEIYDLNKSWGWYGIFLQILRQPKDVIVDHNTIIAPVANALVSVDSAPMSGFVFTNNVAPHNSYGIIGSSHGTGLSTINYFFPDGIVTRNVMAGGKASLYPAGNEFPTVADFQAHFRSYATNDFSLTPGTNWERAGTDGLDLGANIGALQVVHAATIGDPPAVVTTSLPATRELESYSATVSAVGGVAPFRWSVIAGALPAGLALDQFTGAITGATTTQGDYTFMAQVTDATGATASQPLAVHVDIHVPAVEIVTADVTSATATLPFTQAFQAIGGLGTYVWTISGALPNGMLFSSTGVLSGTPTAQGTTQFVMTATDAASATRWASRTFVMTVAKPPNRPPTISLVSPAAGMVAQVGAPLMLTAAAADSDGSVDHVDFYLGANPIGSATGPAFSMPWVAPTSGTYQFTAVAIDNEGAATWSSAVTVGTQSEIVLYASTVARMVGSYQLLGDTTAASGAGLWNPDRGAAKVGAAVANPTSYAELTFFAEAGRPYHLWIRGRAERNDYANDSVYVQFDGVAKARIGTTSSLTVNLEDGANAGLAGWGWQDDAYGIGAIAGSFTFERTGPQTIRLQPREDGLVIDQIVISPQRYLTTAPGALKNDTTIVVP